MSDSEQSGHSQSPADHYVVEVTQAVDRDAPQLIEALADTFSISSDKARKLLKRMPGPVTKAVPYKLAQLVVSKLKQVGIASTIRAQPPHAHVSGQTTHHHHHHETPEDGPLNMPRTHRVSENTIIYRTETPETAPQFGPRRGLQRKPSLITVLIIVLLIAVVVTVYLTQ
jgi:ABC-type nickel/cobalt efflux system permease component RcnA